MDVLESLFCAGSAAVVTVTFIHPVDLLKTRMQISGVNGARNYKALGVLGTVKTIAKEEGVAAFWKGIPAAWLRESSYTSLRLGLYQPCKVLLGADAKDAPFIKKFAAGGIAGGIGSIAGNPFDVLKTKMMAAEGKQVLSFADNVRSIFHSQGIRGFYQGIDANIARAMVNNGTKMACYDTTKQLLKASGVFGKDGIALQFSSGMVAGFFITCTVAPFDMVRACGKAEKTKGVCGMVMGKKTKDDRCCSVLRRLPGGGASCTVSMLFLENRQCSSLLASFPRSRLKRRC